MKAWLFTGAHEPLKLIERKDPKAGPGQEMVDVRAAGLCHSDVGFLDGHLRRHCCGTPRRSGRSGQAGPFGSYYLDGHAHGQGRHLARRARRMAGFDSRCLATHGSWRTGDCCFHRWIRRYTGVLGSSAARRGRWPPGRHTLKTHIEGKICRLTLTLAMTRSM